MEAAWVVAVQTLHLICSAAALALAGLLAPTRRERGPAATAAAIALVLTGGWAIFAAARGPTDLAAQTVLGVANLGWLWTLYRLFAHDGRDKNLAPVRGVLVSLVFVEVLQLALLLAQLNYGALASAQDVLRTSEATLSLLFCVGAVVLVHNLYAGAAQPARAVLLWPAAALAAMWLYDLNTATVTYLSRSPPDVLAELRGAAMLPVMAMLAHGLLRHRGARRQRPSRSFAFQSFSLLAIAGYFLLMALLVQGLSFAGGEIARVAQVALLVFAGAAALAILPSRKLRGWLRVSLTKHLFQHRYDYREEWLRFTATIGRAGANAAPLNERIVQAMADITDSPAGLLLTPREEGGLALAARWQWGAIEVPAEALCEAGVRFFEESQFILDLSDVREARVEGVPLVATPDWLVYDQGAWAMVPLLHYERLMGIVVLAAPAMVRRVDWEDLDLLRVTGRQLASYLAEQASQDALGDARRFDEFNRRIAFVMHDIKNLASQLSLLAHNAEKHADNPAFRADMLVTLRNSADKLQALLARLGRYGHHTDQVRPIDAGEVVRQVVEDFTERWQVVAVDRPACTVLADRDGLEQALIHLIQNAIEASPPGAPVFVDVRHDTTTCVIEVIDSGPGMSPEFVRTRLFRPFHSTKPNGFGIGAFEARELIRAMGGWLDVESREALGTRFLLRLPLARPGQAGGALPAGESEVA